MKQLKKSILCLALVFCVMGLAACGRKNNTNDTTKATESTKATEKITTTENNTTTEKMKDTNGKVDGNDTILDENTTEKNTNNDATTKTGDGDGVVNEIGDDIRNGVENIADDMDGNNTKETVVKETR